MSFTNNDENQEKDTVYIKSAALTISVTIISPAQKMFSITIISSSQKMFSIYFNMDFL